MTDEPAVELVSISASVRLVVVGGALVLHQRFSGRVANSSEFVAKSALTGTLIKYHCVAPPGMKFVSGPLLVNVMGDNVKLVLANVKFNVQPSSAALLVAPARLSKTSSVHSPKALVPLR